MKGACHWLRRSKERMRSKFAEDISLQTPTLKTEMEIEAYLWFSALRNINSIS